MLWIHGGAFEWGASRDYNPSVLVALNDVIVVTINYRLGVLGFFNIPGTDVKGNFGMHDQVGFGNKTNQKLFGNADHESYKLFPSCRLRLSNGFNKT